jgi:hypothetical protein
MINQPAPMNSISIEPMDKPMGGAMGGLPPLKMLPDMDSDYDNSGDLDAHEKDHADENPLIKTLDQDDDGDHDMDDHDMEKKKDKEEAFGNSVGDSEPETKDVDYMVNKLAGGMNRPKQMVKHSYKQGDNPMAMPEGDLRAAIRAELLQRLAEAKGAK